MTHSLPWHPLIVHFPLALVLTAALALWLARLLPGGRVAARLSLVGTWNLVAGAVAAIFALGSGLVALGALHLGPPARQAAALHAKWAMFASFLLLLAAVWRGAGNDPDARPGWAFLVLLSLAAGALIVTGFHGGENVYVYGMGVAGLGASVTQ